MNFEIVTLFPRLIEDYCREGLLGSARDRGIVGISTVNPRDFTQDVHKTVDDRAFGGGDGMVMKPEPLVAAIGHIRAKGPARVVVLSPQGEKWTQAKARAWAEEGGTKILVCGRYAGIDQRFIVKYADEEISLGDFVLNGGELAALSLVESVTRLLPGVLGNELSPVRDSFSEELLEAPQFTRPREWEGLPVPAPLLSGHHEEIAAFQSAAALVNTALRRPDLVSAKKEKIRQAARELSRLSDPELAAMGFTRAALEELK